jgi:tetratricopeptide (TPR) repeat protein
MSESVGELIRSGYRNPYYGKRVEARLRRAIALEPDNAEAHFVLGKALFRTRNYVEAANEYRIALACPPRLNDERPYLGVNMYVAHRGKAALDAEVHLAWGDLHRKLGRLEEALKEYLLAVPGSADAGWAYLSAAHIYKQLGRLDLALEQYRHAVRYDFAIDSAGDIHGGVTAEYAQALFKNGDYSQAAEASRRAIGQGFMDYLGLAQALRRLDHLDGAIEAYREGLIRMPDRPPLRKGLALALMESGQVDAAIEELQLAIRRHPSRELFPMLARAHLKKGDPESAAAAYREALAMYPNWPPALRGLERHASSHLVKQTRD